MNLFGNLFGDNEEAAPKVDLTQRYQLIGRVGQGSMSKVWRAEDPFDGRILAIKVLDKEKTKKFEARFENKKKPNEGEIALSLRHPYVVNTLEVGQTLEDEMYLIMDYVEGSGLSLLVDLQGEQLVRHRISYMIQIGEALDYFHKKNWIHRDICPRNIMVTENNQIRLIDFGLTVPNTAEFRRPGNRTGTANYMAPELIKRQETDQRIDVFSYAVTCYEMYTKRHPWDAAMTIEAVMQHINKLPLKIQELVPGIDPQIADTIMRGLEANPADRWQTADEMVKEFRVVEERLVKEFKDALVRKRQRAAQQAVTKKKTRKAKRKSGSSGKSKLKAKDNSAEDGDEAIESENQALPEVKKSKSDKDTSDKSTSAEQASDKTKPSVNEPPEAKDGDDEEPILSLD